MVIVFLLIANFVFVIAADTSSPSVSVEEEDVAELQGIIDQLPFDESGETNYSRYKPFYSKAEQRIDAINLWLDDNAGWMRYLFHMRPQVSILFTLNLYFMLFFLLILVINAPGLWFFIQSANKARMFGAAIFVVFATVGLYVGLAHVATNFILYIWYILVDAAIWLAIIAIVILIILAIFAFPAIGAIFRGITRYYEVKKKAKQAMEQAAGSDSINKMVEQMTKK